MTNWKFQNSLKSYISHFTYYFSIHESSKFISWWILFHLWNNFSSYSDIKTAIFFTKKKNKKKRVSVKSLKWQKLWSIQNQNISIYTVFCTLYNLWHFESLTLTQKRKCIHQQVAEISSIDRDKLPEWVSKIRIFDISKRWRFEYSTLTHWPFISDVKYYCTNNYKLEIF